MKNFDKVCYNGTFRNYQQYILDNEAQHHKNKKIHIVAAPGSGKTILGLEIIRRIGKPALVVSPSITIRQQWGERFESGFISNESNEKYISYDLKKPELITSVTYQALYAAYNKIKIKDEIEEDNDLETEEDFTEFDLLKTIKNSGIKTICLDEAHHLHNEWQKALENFIHDLGEDIITIALTATPPYDSTPEEWKKYIDLCGEIDEEIFVPQLVAQKTLCPHQDYIFFNYPTILETDIFKEYKEKSKACVLEIVDSGIIQKALKNSKILEFYRENEELILSYEKEFGSLIYTVKQIGIEIPKGLMKLITPSKKSINLLMKSAQTSFQFIIDNPSIFGDDVSAELNKKLAQNGLIEKKKVCLLSNDKINKMLLTSSGKLQSINQIVLSESKNLSSDLRMLILTDYIKKDLYNNIGTENEMNCMGTVPIFESIRRNYDDLANIALLSGSLVIVPNKIVDYLIQKSKDKQVDVKVKLIPNTSHSEMIFSGTNKNRVSVMTEAFQNGKINILVGTKSLLGEGWDSPCINSLILASFVGSFMLSNQMRGRAIRVDNTNPNKTANIWHLVTLEPTLIYSNKVTQALFSDYVENINNIVSDDFETVKRRFACFLGPKYNEDIIESGIERIDIIKPPYNKEGFININNRMLEQSNDRIGMSKRWENSLCRTLNPVMNEINEISPKIQPKSFLFQNIFAETMLIIVLSTFIKIGTSNIISSDFKLPVALLSIVIYAIFTYFIIVGLIKILHFISPIETVKTLSNCVLKTLKDIGEIESDNAKSEVKSDNVGFSIYCFLSNATLHEKNLYTKSISEMLSAINNPRYVLIKSCKILWLTKKVYRQSYACPSIIGNKKENVEILLKYIKKYAGNFSLFYTRNEDGRKVLLKSRRYSYININDSYVNSKKTF